MDLTFQFAGRIAILAISALPYRINPDSAPRGSLIHHRRTLRPRAGRRQEFDHRPSRGQPPALRSRHDVVLRDM